MQSPSDNDNESLDHRWRRFIGVLLDPWIIILLVSTGAAGYATTERTGLPSILVTSILSFLSAILGVRAMNLWNAQSEKASVSSRGVTAVRSLKLLYSDIMALQRRIVYFRRSGDSKEIVARNYEETINLSTSLANAVLVAIENWEDLVPEANIKKEIDATSALLAELKIREEELSDAKERERNLESATSEGTEKHQEEVAALERTIKKLQKDIQDHERKAGLLPVRIASGEHAFPLFESESDAYFNRAGTFTIPMKNKGKGQSQRPLVISDLSELDERNVARPIVINDPTAEDKRNNPKK